MRTFALPSIARDLRHVLGDATVVAFNVGPSGDVWIVQALESLDDRRPDAPSASAASRIATR